MAKVKIKITGEKIRTLVDGIKGAACTEVTKIFDQFNTIHAGKVIADEKTKDYYDEELVVENVNR